MVTAPVLCPRADEDRNRLPAEGGAGRPGDGAGSASRPGPPATTRSGPSPGGALEPGSAPACRLGRRDAWDRPRHLGSDQTKATSRPVSSCRTPRSGSAARECCPQPLAFRLPVNTRCPGRSVRTAYSTGRPSEQDRMLGRKSQDPTSSAAQQLGAAYHLMLKYRAVSHGSYRHLCASRPSASKSAAVAVCGLSDRPDASGRATRARRTIDHHMNLPLGGPSPAPLAGPTAARAPRAALFSRPSSSVTLLAMGHSSTSVAEGI